VLQTLESAGIPALVVGGAALAQTIYPEPAQRPILVSEIIVPFEQGGAAIRQLQSAGWQPTPRLPLTEDAPARRWLSSYRFANADGQILQLGWHVLPDAPAADAELWNRAILLTIADTTTRTLPPTDHLIRVCLTAAPHYPIGLADAARLIDGGAIDWSLLLEISHKHRLGLPLAHCLSLLAETIASPVPPKVLQTLRQNPAPYYQRQAHRALLISPIYRHRGHRFWLHYGRYRSRSGSGSPIDFMKYLKVVWQIRQS